MTKIAIVRAVKEKAGLAAAVGALTVSESSSDTGNDSRDELSSRKQASQAYNSIKKHAL